MNACSNKKFDYRKQTLEFLANVSHLLVYSFLLQLTYPRTSDIRNELQKKGEYRK